MSRYSIDEIVNLWDLDYDEKTSKKEILKKWKRSVKNSEHKTLLEITKDIIYYSEKKVNHSFKKVFPNAITSKESRNIIDIGCEAIEKEDYSIIKSLFYPLRNYERYESSNSIFTNFKHSINIPPYLLSVDRVDFMIRDKLKFHNKLDELKDKRKNNRNCKDTEKNLVDFLHKYQKEDDFEYLVIIDDFIGTGKSIETYLDKLNKDVNLFYLLKKKYIKLIFVVIEVSDVAIERLNSYSKQNEINFSIIYSKISSDILNKVYPEINLRTEKSKQLEELFENFLIRKNDYCINNASVTYANSPNNNIPFIYSETEKWVPLFPREKEKTRKIRSKEEIRNRLRVF